MNASTSVNLTEIMEREGIKKIERICNRHMVLLFDGRIGIADSVGAALALAKKPDADNVLRLVA